VVEEEEEGGGDGGGGGDEGDWVTREGLEGAQQTKEGCEVNNVELG